LAISFELLKARNLVFFRYFYSAHVDAAVIREIGCMGITTISWYCNASYQFHLVQDIAPAYQYEFVWENWGGEGLAAEEIKLSEGRLRWWL
jgi:hypothetical protein